MHRPKLVPALMATLAVVLTANQSHAQTLTTVLSSNGTDGAGPRGDLTVSGSTLYGAATFGGGGSSYGNFFSVPVTGGTPSVLVSFDGTNGANPQGSLTLSGSTLYGMKSQGGTYG